MKTKEIRLKKTLNFRQLLQEELVNRCRQNPNYSLRSFARALKVEPSALSQIINGKRPLTEKMKLRLGMALGLSTKQIEKIPTSQNVSISSYQQIAMDSFAIVSDWYHYAIIELTYLEEFKPEATWISRRLGITKSEANIAIERLFRLDLLVQDENGRWIDTSENGQLTQIHPGLTSDAARKYQSQLLELSKLALQEISLEKRSHTSAAFCFDVEDLPQAIESIGRFRRQFAEEFQPKNKANEVYQIQISFFPLTKNIKPKDNV
jgi:transcriptional regulator with XRE-family HTH domain